MRWPAPTSLAAIVSVVALLGASRPADIAFRVQMIDPGYGETVTVADINRDGKLDIVSGEHWFEAPGWTKHPLRAINYSSGYIDNFADLAMDVDGDGWTDIIQFSYFAHNIVWLKNPGKAGGEWKASEIDNSGPTEFAFLVDLDNDGKANELLPEFDRPSVPAAWFEHRDGKWIKHVVAPQSYGHGIGVGDMNGDGRNDILTPKGWLEAPADVRAEGYWKFHPTDWGWKYIPPSGTPADEVKLSAAAQRGGAQFGYMYLLDINGDGRKDLLTGMAHDYGLAWYEQTADGHFVQHVIDSSWSQAHASQLVDMNGDGQPDLVIGKRYFAHNGGDPGEREPVGIYWYEWGKVSPATAQNGGVEWVRHIVDYGGRMGGGVQTVAVDIDGDGDIDVVSANKSGLFLAENLTKSPTKGGRR
ncbi:VCBS repeat-containing protein [Terriglobus sp. TAA 43]|uniref:FG-GAP repeat domain-containing protein n=1 Tax=Terriglobus sp. TAA 43 TaxID=278961 RepID=UPI00068A3F6E|nr:VCBS repeat-containing protein [Terriglobus sp. TAA 43]